MEHMMLCVFLIFEQIDISNDAPLKSSFFFAGAVARPYKPLKCELVCNYIVTVIPGHTCKMDDSLHVIWNTT